MSTKNTEKDAPRLETKSAQRTALKQPEPVSAKKAFVYLGPYIRGGILSTGGVYCGYPAHAEELFKEIPEIKELFVEARDVPAFKKELAKQGTEAHRLYQQALMSLHERGGRTNG